MLNKYVYIFSNEIILLFLLNDYGSEEPSKNLINNESS